MAEIKTDENASEASNQDSKDGVSGVTYNARKVAKSRWFIQDPTDVT